VALGAALGALLVVCATKPEPQPRFTCPAPSEFETKAMHSAMEGEERGEVWDTSVTYLGPEERRPYALRIEEGKVLDATGGLYDTKGALAIFVLDPDGTPFASTEAERGHFHHSSFVAGGPVAAAGEIAVASGTPTTVTNRSGHYRPGQVLTGQFLCHLRSHGVDLSRVRLVLQDGRIMPASSYLSEG
jgi:hypothetical protein